MDKKLSTIANTQGNSGSQKAVKFLANQVCEKVMGTPNVSVARVLITRINVKSQYYVDLIVFVNKSTLDLLSVDQKEEDTLNIFLGQLTTIPGFQLSNAVSGNLLQFTLPSSFIFTSFFQSPFRVAFDLVVATNLGDQVPSAFEGIGENLIPTATIHWYGPGLVEPTKSVTPLGFLFLLFGRPNPPPQPVPREAVALAKELSRESTRDLVRLAKMWDKILKTRDPNLRGPPGRSYMIELIAIAAQKEGIAIAETDKKDFVANSLVFGFAKFLISMSGLQYLRVVFTENYSYEQIPVDISGSRPLVMDPLNCYYNAAQGIDSESAKKYEAYASESLRILGDFTNQMYPLNIDNFHKLMGFSD